MTVLAFITRNNFMFKKIALATYTDSILLKVPINKRKYMFDFAQNAQILPKKGFQGNIWI